MSEAPVNRRILVVDDNQAIHDDFRKILVPCMQAAAAAAELDDLAASVLGEESPASGNRQRPTYELTNALQGQEALAAVEAAADRDEPFAMVFMDVRMPPGWDGIETLRRLWEVDPELQAVVCTAYADYSYEDIVESLGDSDRFLILKKPFDTIEVQQLASTLTQKWKLRREIREHLDQIEAYAKSLETVNLALEADKRVAEASALAQSEFLLGAGRAFEGPARRLSDSLGALAAAREDVRPASDLARDLAVGLHHLHDLAALETGNHHASGSTCDLRSALESVGALTQAHAANRAVPVRLLQATPVPAEASIDGDLLVRCLECVTAWAIDRADARGVDVTLGMTDTDAVVPELTIEIACHSAPISEAERELLFMPFRASENRPDRVLALPLAKIAAEELGARLELDTGLDGGLRIEVRVDPGPGGAERVEDLWPPRSAA